MGKVGDYFLEVAKVVLLVLVIVLPIRYFLFQPFMVRGVSMEPSFEQSDYLMVDQVSYNFRDPERGEVVVFHYPDNPQKRHIKRIIGLPEERVVIEEGRISVEKDGELKVLEENYILSSGRKDEEVTLEENEYFVVGDNREASFDSRNWGSLPRENIIGRVFFQVSPFDIFGFVERPEY